MALCFPERPQVDTPDSERIVFAALANLPDPWRVIHSVAWQSATDGGSGDGEIDFVLLHPDHGLVVVEVKGGGISVEGGQWFSSGRGGRHPIKDPFDQATSAKHTLVRYLRSTDSKLPFIPATHAVAFPDVPRADRLGPNAPRELTLLRPDLRDIHESIKRVIQHADLSAQLSEDHIDRITALLAPTTHVRRLLADDVADAGARLIHLTNEQFRYLDFCRRQRRAVIVGGAGTGKTVLAVERARRLAIDGFRVLLTCFNRPLADFLRAELRGVAQVVVYNFASLGRFLIGRAGMEFPDDPDPEWWDDTLPAMVVEAAEAADFAVDAVVIDEGQDFPPSWFTALQMLLTDPDHGPMYVFADSHQSIYRDGWEPPFPAEPFELNVNCRNTRPIAELVASVFADELADRGVDGPPPRLITSSELGPASKVTGLIKEWIASEGLRPDQIAVICQHRATVNELRGQRVGDHVLTPLGGDGITCETIHRFKGLEADAVVVVLDSIETEQERMLAYVGMSRARSLLAVVAPPEVLAVLSAT